MTFPHSHRHSRTILGFLVGFSVNNLSFLVFSSLRCRSMYYLSIAFSHSATLTEYTHRHTCVARPPSWNDKNLVLSFVIYYCRWSHHFMTSLPLAILPLHVFIYSDFYHFLSFLPSLPLCMFMFIQMHVPLFLSLPPPPHTHTQSPSLHPCVQLLLPASFP